MMKNSEEDGKGQDDNEEEAGVEKEEKEVTVMSEEKHDEETATKEEEEKQAAVMTEEKHVKDNEEKVAIREEREVAAATVTADDEHIGKGGQEEEEEIEVEEDDEKEDTNDDDDDDDENCGVNEEEGHDSRMTVKQMEIDRKREGACEDDIKKEECSLHVVQEEDYVKEHSKGAEEEPNRPENKICPLNATLTQTEEGSEDLDVPPKSSNPFDSVAEHECSTECDARSIECSHEHEVNVDKEDDFKKDVVVLDSGDDANISLQQNGTDDTGSRKADLNPFSSSETDGEFGRSKNPFNDECSDRSDSNNPFSGVSNGNNSKDPKRISHLNPFSEHASIAQNSCSSTNPFEKEAALAQSSTRLIPKPNQKSTSSVNPFNNSICKESVKKETKENGKQGVLKSKNPLDAVKGGKSRSKELSNDEKKLLVMGFDKSQVIAACEGKSFDDALSFLSELVLANIRLEKSVKALFQPPLETRVGSWLPSKKGTSNHIIYYVRVEVNRMRGFSYQLEKTYEEFLKLRKKLSTPIFKILPAGLCRKFEDNRSWFKHDTEDVLNKRRMMLDNWLRELCRCSELMISEKIHSILFKFLEVDSKVDMHQMTS